MDEKRHEEMKKMMNTSFGKLREAMDRLQKRIVNGAFSNGTNDVGESMHDMIDFMLIRATMEMFLTGTEQAMANEELKDPEKRKQLEFDEGTDEDDATPEEIKEFLEEIFGRDKDGDADA